MERRSAKSTRVRKVYTNDAFEGVDELQDLCSEDEMSVNASVDEDDSDDNQDTFVQTLDQSSEDDYDDMDGNASDEKSDMSGDGGDEALEGAIPVMDDIRIGRTVQRKKKGVTPRAPKKAEDGAAFITRGVVEHHEQSKDTNRLFNFGASNKDHEAVNAAKWRWHQNATLPRRFTDSDGRGGMHESFFLNKQEFADEAQAQKKWWYEDGGMQAVRDQQSMQSIDEAQAVAYMPEKQAGPLTCLMGPINGQHLMKIEPGEVISLPSIWSQQNHEPRADESETYKSGFILNLGAKVHCLDWAPNQTAAEQYLAASVISDREMSHAPFEATEAPAFTPSPPHKSNIQIWRFLRSSSGFIDTQTPPKLDLVLCTDWGDVKTLKWCPMLHPQDDSSDSRHVGLLAGIWSDGAVRILDISVTRHLEQTRYANVRAVAFESRPPNAVCTCLAWISSTRIAAGCSNGCISIWDLPKSLESAAPTTRPTIYANISSTYILSMTTCYPSRPNLLITGSMAGVITLTDLSRSGQSLVSQASTVHGNRIRMGLPLLNWNDFGQLVIQAEDNLTVKGCSIRSFFASAMLARSRSIATSLATSSCHPFLLVGCANGEVFATKPFNKIVEPSRHGAWQQVWFAHEWRRPPNPASDENASTGTSSIGSEGISRIAEGFKAELVGLAADGGQKYDTHAGTKFTTVYEERSAVTAAAWNPNQHVGGWAAAGMGDGLLRVEDISI